MLRSWGIARRMILFLAVGSGAILTALIAYSTWFATGVLEKELEARARNLAAATAARIDGVQRSVASTAAGLALTAGEVPREGSRWRPILEKTVSSNAEVFGSAIARRPGMTAPGQAGVAYIYRSRDGLAYKDLASESYSYETKDWFTLPRDLGRPVWTEPYYDDGGGEILMATYAVPLYGPGGSGEFWGVALCDVSLAWLTDYLESLPFDGEGYAFLISCEGRVISHPTRRLIMNESIFSLAEARNDADLRGIGRRMIRGETGFTPFRSLTTQQPCRLAFAPVPSTGWSVGVVFRREQILSKVRQLAWVQLLLGFAGFLLLLLLVVVIAKSITRPLSLLAAATRTLARGDLATPLPAVRGQDEVATLSASFETMREDLRARVEDLKRATAAKARMEKELQIAHDIQMELVPETFPPYPGRSDFDLHALLRPAREVGGDLYDFYMPDDGSLCVAVGDVSGKGVPAALLMAVTRTYMKAFAQDEDAPAATLARINLELCQGNEACMFVTLFCASLDLSSGRLRVGNAGHNPPLRISAAGQISWFPKVGGIPVGIQETARYEDARLRLEPGESLLLYTDGVTEAQNRSGEFFGEARLLEALEGCREGDCRGMVEGILDAVDRFAGGMEQADDITLLAVRYLGPSKGSLEARDSVVKRLGD